MYDSSILVSSKDYSFPVTLISPCQPGLHTLTLQEGVLPTTSNIYYLSEPKLTYTLPTYQSNNALCTGQTYAVTKRDGNPFTNAFVAYESTTRRITVETDNPLHVQSMNLVYTM